MLWRQLFTLLQIQRHEVLVHLHNLVDDARMRFLHRREIRIAVGVEEAIHHILATVRRKIDGQTLFAENILDARQQRRQVHIVPVDLVDDDHAAQPAFACPAHHALGVQLDAVLRVDDDDRRFHCCQRADGLTGEIRHAWRVDEMDVDALVGEVD